SDASAAARAGSADRPAPARDSARPASTTAGSRRNAPPPAQSSASRTTPQNTVSGTAPSDSSLPQMQIHEISTGTEAIWTKAVRCIYRLLWRAMSRARRACGEKLEGARRRATYGGSRPPRSPRRLQSDVEFFAEQVLQTQTWLWKQAGRSKFQEWRANR